MQAIVRYIGGAFTILVVFSILGFFGAREFYGIPETEERREVVESYDDLPSFGALLAHGEEDVRILECALDGCDAKPRKAGAVLMHGYWYYYAHKADDIIALVRTSEDDEGHTEVIVEQTPLVMPRDMIPSPDRSKLAYWLDDTANDTGLTELWVYKSREGGTRLVAEKIDQSDVVTPVRWNATGTALWYLTRSGEGVALKVITLYPEDVHESFAHVNWSALEDVAASGAMDVHSDGRRIAIAREVRPSLIRLSIMKDSGEEERHLLTGDISYMQWMEDELVYVTHSDQEFVFWRTDGSEHVPLARMTGSLQSVLGDMGEYVVFVAQSARTSRSHMYVFEIRTGRIKDQGALPIRADSVRLVELSRQQEQQIAGITSELSDGELVAFIERHSARIIGIPDVRVDRITATDWVNSVYIDYESEGVRQRVLVTIQDAIHPEWVVRAWYEPHGGSWRRVRGGILEDPSALRVYEWEEHVGQWILKQDAGV